MNQRQYEDMQAQIFAHDGMATKGYKLVKGIDGTFSAVRESDITDERDDADTFPNRGQRVGDARVMAPIISRENTSREYASAGSMSVPLDPFLHRTEDGAMIGGATVAGGQVRPPQTYVFDEPDADRRDEQNWPGERTESGIAPAASFRPAQPGNVGGTPPGDYVVKSKSKGLWSNIFKRGDADGVDTAADFMSSHRDREVQ